MFIKNYFQCSDEELEIKAAKYRIPTYDGRKSGNIDRMEIINYLLKKDAITYSTLSIIIAIISLIVAIFK